MKLAMAQIKNEGSIEKNLAKCIAAIEKSAEQGADLIQILLQQLKKHVHEIILRQCLIYI
jgi:hypothetical protein